MLTCKKCSWPISWILTSFVTSRICNYWCGIYGRPDAGLPASGRGGGLQPVAQPAHGVDQRRLARGLPEAPVLCADTTVAIGERILGKPVDLAAVNRLLDAATGIELVEEGDYPTAVGDAVGQDVIYVGRVRAGVDDPAELNLWLTSDNVRKGAALNAVQVAELLIKDLL